MANAEQVLSGAEYIRAGLRFKERDGLAFRTRSPTDKSYAMRDAILTLRGRIAWPHDFNPDRNSAATFQTLPGASFVVNGAAQASDSALTTASDEIKWTNGWSATVTSKVNSPA